MDMASTSELQDVPPELQGVRAEMDELKKEVKELKVQIAAADPSAKPALQQERNLQLSRLDTLQKKEERLAAQLSPGEQQVRNPIRNSSKGLIMGQGAGAAGPSTLVGTSAADIVITGRIGLGISSCFSLSPGEAGAKGSQGCRGRGQSTK